MKLKLLFIVFFASFLSVYANSNDAKFTQSSVFLQNEDASVTFLVGNSGITFPWVTLNCNIPAGNYRFLYTYSMGTVTGIWGGGSFPSGTPSGAIPWISIPAGVYNIFFSNQNTNYTFVAVSPRMLVTSTNSFALTSTGNGTYAANNVIIPYDDNARFMIDGVIYSGAGFPTGQTSGPGNYSYAVTAGTYYVQYNDNGNYSYSPALGIADVETKKIKVYPNPSSDNWNFVFGNDIADSVTIYDSTGKSVLSGNPSQNEFSMDASALSAGIYFATVQINGNSRTMWLIKK